MGVGGGGRGQGGTQIAVKIHILYLPRVSKPSLRTNLSCLYSELVSDTIKTRLLVASFSSQRRLKQEIRNRKNC